MISIIWYIYKIQMLFHDIYFSAITVDRSSIYY